jgi:hypothetical protein
MTKGYKFKTLTGNGRLSSTEVFKPAYNIVVIRQRVLAKQEDIDAGWFGNSKTIYQYKDYLLREVELTLWQQSFDTIKKIIKKLNH